MVVQKYSAHRCPHIAYTGNVCVYCPGGPDSDFEYSTQAYTGYEPTSMRAIRARYVVYGMTVSSLEIFFWSLIDDRLSYLTPFSLRFFSIDTIPIPKSLDVYINCGPLVIP
jgi:hypothetical protein